MACVGAVHTRFAVHAVFLACSRAFFREASRIETNRAMIERTTSNSTSVNPAAFRPRPSRQRQSLDLLSRVPALLPDFIGQDSVGGWRAASSYSTSSAAVSQGILVHTDGDGSVSLW